MRFRASVINRSLDRSRPLTQITMSFEVTSHNHFYTKYRPVS